MRARALRVWAAAAGVILASCGTIPKPDPLAAGWPPSQILDAIEQGDYPLRCHYLPCQWGLEEQVPRLDQLIASGDAAGAARIVVEADSYSGIGYYYLARVALLLHDYEAASAYAEVSIDLSYRGGYPDCDRPEFCRHVDLPADAERLAQVIRHAALADPGRRPGRTCRSTDPASGLLIDRPC